MAGQPEQTVGRKGDIVQRLSSTSTFMKAKEAFTFEKDDRLRHQTGASMLYV